METKSNKSVYGSIYKDTRAYQSQESRDERTVLRVVTLRFLYILLGILLPHVGFLVLMIIKDYRKKDAKFLLAGVIIGIIYFLFVILGLFMFLNPSW